MRKPKNDLLQGTLALLVLKTLARGALHGYGITLHIQLVSKDILRVEEGSLYPALHRMEQDGWVSAEWGISENNRRARYSKCAPQTTSPQECRRSKRATKRKSASAIPPSSRKTLAKWTSSAGWTKPHAIFATHCACCFATPASPSSLSSLWPSASAPTPRFSPSSIPSSFTLSPITIRTTW